MFNDVNAVWRQSIEVVNAQLSLAVEGLRCACLTLRFGGLIGDKPLRTG